ncbi:FAD:protein FMN transferase [Sorangium sp. So ce1151]|uniref:FAD:protein FMN transferase n=1 Tax=Sorangium sp. So ce1151 TaxID=3133332 RepID=UPI003F5FE754
MHGPRCPSRPLLCFCLAALLAPAACDAPGCARAREESAPAASTETSAPAAIPGAAAQAGPARVVVEARAMGTSLVVAAYPSEAMDEAAIRGRLDKAIAEIRRLEGLMTTWRPESELSRVNAAAGRSAVEVSPESLEVIEKSLWISERSGGVFDITFEAMHGLWKFDEDIDDNVPPRDDVERARGLIDYRQIAIDRARRTVMLARPGMRMSLGGIAKGYAVDAAARVLRGEGLGSFFVQAGGDLYIAGKKPDGSRWRAGIRDPRGKGASDYFAMVEVEDHAFSTAGDYERSFIKEGRRYHHIIDPRTGFPASESRSVTVWAKDALTADAVDDAVFILGAEKGLELVESIEDCGAVIVDRNNKVWVSKRLEGKVEVLRQPTDGV